MRPKARWSRLTRWLARFGPMIQMEVKESVHLMARRVSRALPGWAILGIKGPGGGYRLVRVEK